MRKKIGKRIGPVPIALALAVFALAAFLAIYSVQPDTALAVAPPPVNHDYPDPVPEDCKFDITSGLSVEVAGGDCATSDDTLDVILQNINTTETREAIVIVTGGTNYSVQAMSTEAGGVEAGPIGKRGLGVEIVNRSRGHGYRHLG